MFDECFSLVNLWCGNESGGGAIKAYQKNLQNALNIRLLNFVIGFYCKVPPSGHKGIKKAYSIASSSGVMRESIMNDFRTLSALLKNNTFFFGIEPTVHDLGAFSTLAQLHLLYKDIQYPLPTYTMEYFSSFYLVSVEEPAEEYVVQYRLCHCGMFEVCEYLPEYAEENQENEDRMQAKILFLKEYDDGTCTMRSNTIHIHEEFEYGDVYEYDYEYENDNYEMQE